MARELISTIQLLLTLAIADALIVTVSGQTFAVPAGLPCGEVLQVEPANLMRCSRTTSWISYRAGVLPLVRLDGVFRPARPAGGFVPHARGRHGSQRAVQGLAVEPRDRMCEEIVVRPLADALLGVPGIAGVTVLGDGRVVLIFDAVPLGAGGAVKQSRAGGREGGGAGSSGRWLSERTPLSPPALVGVGVRGRCEPAGFHDLSAEGS